ncbi:hypothetical protein Sjap_008344 [Stephania japonica]|uniref:Uncharacterized protein n=1 Tax=Stephania japonica TaxID=461633 RepID=A0AAP0JQ55_9MAGN
MGDGSPSENHLILSENRLFYKKFLQDKIAAIRQEDSEIVEAWFDQAAKYWKKTITLTPALMLFARWFHYLKAAPKLAWFQDVESMLNHHLAGLLGLRSLGWAGHQVHVS